MPSERFAQWTLTNWFADQARFFRVDLEPVLSRGRAYVFKNGSIDFEAMRQRFGAITNYWTNGITYSTPVIFKEPEEAWQENLGAYDTNGLLIGSNEGKLTGFYGYTRINSIDWHPDWEHLPDIPRLSLASNDFRVEFTGASNGLPRESIMWASEAMFYWAITDFRTRFLNHAFVTELNLPPDLASNILHRQYRPDLNMPTNESTGPVIFDRPLLAAEEMFGFSPSLVFRFSPIQNAYGVAVRTREPTIPLPDTTPLSLLFDAEATVADYAGLVAFWILGAKTGFPHDSPGWEGPGWADNLLPAINDGISGWVAYRYSGNSDIYRESHYEYRRSQGYNCGGTSVPCDKGEPIRNVMME